MKNWIIIIQAFCILLCSVAFASASDLKYPDVVLTPKDRILILAPHPDDEALACGGVIQEAVEKGLPIRIVFFTYGDNNEWSFLVYRLHPVIKSKAVQKMGLVRYNEAHAADEILGVAPSDLTFLGYPDFGTLSIFYYYWGDVHPFKSMLTKVQVVPYANALRPGALYKGEEILKDLESILREFKPTKIFLSHPADHNLDHRSLYLFTRVAVWNLEKEIKPELYPYLVHFKNWPMPRGYYPEKKLEPPLFFNGLIPWENFTLTKEEANKKGIALKAHKSQYESSSKYLSSFVRINELFGDFEEIKLIPDAPPVSLSPGRKEYLLESPEKLLDREQAFFLGTEEKYVQLKNNNIEVLIKFSKVLSTKMDVFVLIFGYRFDKPFAKMPKLRIKLKGNKCMIYDKKILLDNSGINVIRGQNQIIIQIPLDLIGNPNRVMTSILSYIGSVPLDWVSWRIIELSE